MVLSYWLVFYTRNRGTLKELRRRLAILEQSLPFEYPVNRSVLGPDPFGDTILAGRACVHVSFFIPGDIAGLAQLAIVPAAPVSDSAQHLAVAVDLEELAVLACPIQGLPSWSKSMVQARFRIWMVFTNWPSPV